MISPDGVLPPGNFIVLQWLSLDLLEGVESMRGILISRTDYSSFIQNRTY